MSRLLIKGGRIVTAVDDYPGDVLIDGSTIAAIFAHGQAPASDAPVLDATGKLVIPGGIDAHTHLDMPFGGTTSADDFESGTIAAAHGGTTSIVDFAIQYKGQALREARDAWMKKAEGKAAIDYGFHMIITDLPDAVENVIDVLVRRALAEGHMAPKWHALTRPPRAEAEATYRAICLAEMANVPLYVVHLSAAEALEKIAEARARGLPMHAETCPQYLFLSYDNYEEPGFEGAKYVMSPPLRAKGNEEALWRGLRMNDLQAVSTDHCPFCMKEQKELGKGDFSKIPNGAPGIETRMSLLWDGGVVKGRISPNRFVELTSTSPAKIFGLFPKKGAVAPGSDADLVVFDPNRKITLSAKTLHQRVDYTPYEGRVVQGAADTVISRGEVIIENGTFVGRAGRGSFLKRKART